MRSLLSATKIIAKWELLRGSFWFLPSVMAAGGALLSFAAVQLDAAMEADAYRRFEFIYLFGPEGARAILSAVATSMITVAGLTFAITMLTLQLASSQFGPRLLRNFMRDRGNQFVLGTFISTFVYCLLVLRTVKGVEGASFVPHLAVAIGVVLAVAGLAVLIYFIHHTASSIRLETLLSSLASETAVTIDRLFPEKLGHGETEAELPDFRHGHVIHSKASGYVQSIDSDALLRLATEQNLCVEMVAGPGTFVTEYDPLLRVLTKPVLGEDKVVALRETFIVGIERTPYQDLEFSNRRIVEISQRALSLASTTRRLRSIASTGFAKRSYGWPRSGHPRAFGGTTRASYASSRGPSLSKEWRLARSVPLRVMLARIPTCSRRSPRHSTR